MARLFASVAQPVQMIFAGAAPINVAICARACSTASCACLP
jgi:hypothetical protein